MSDLVDWPTDQPIRISGAPSALRAPLTVRSDASPAAAIPQPALVELRGSSGQAVAARSLGLVRGQMRLRLDPATPPGRYEGVIDIAGAARPVEVDVIETIDLAVHPSSVLIDVAMGRAQTVQAAIQNRGNVALTIDLTGVYPLGEELPVYPERLAAGESDGLQRLADLFARTIGTRAPRAMREAGQVTLAMPEGGFTLEPGASRTAAVSVTVPPDLSPVARYRAFIPIYSTDLELILVTATKQTKPETRKSARRQGAST